ncbi:alpha/beta hydrolase-fold protein [Acetivibrio cellulolyticus]|uniref:alpha/beta hydrolase-fold protein n=1 Tax=Acetivibrio cellulolyticus TaxID=35830 RepID=UPI0001E2F09B|nr:alpha/beta hydrolase-fold protein [Acetivibrio cellulolyticus]
MKQLKRSFFIILCSLMVLSLLSGCSENSKKKSISYLNSMTNTEKSKVLAEPTELGDHITLFDEEIGSTYEINLLKSSSYDASKKASFYLVQGTTFNGTQLTALRDYLNSNASQTLLAIINTSKDSKATASANRDFVKDAKAYQAFLTDNMLGWVCENYKIDTDNICFAGYETAGYFAAYLLHTSNSVANYLIVNPNLNKKTDESDISSLEAAFFTGGNTSLSANVCIFRSEDDQKTLAFSKTDKWINSLTEHKYQGLTLNNKILAGAGHNIIDCEALIRGICYFSKLEYSDKEAACVSASKAMTNTEVKSITVGKLSKEHEFYNEVIGIDPGTAEYINEIVMYDEEINDSFVIHLSLPPNYDETKSYPLVLMTDGVWRLSDHPELRKLMKSNELENVILASVGYPNGYDYRLIRERDLLEKPDLYLQFLIENLIPYLYNNYRIDTTRTTLTGHSYGGYWGLYALFHSDTIGKNTFANYYIGSPSFQASTNNAAINDFEDWFYERKQTLACSVYATVGGDEEAAFINLIETSLNDIKKHSYKDFTLKYEVINDFDHNTVFKPSIKNALEMFYNSK